jgi:hypothetical protein
MFARLNFLRVAVFAEVLRVRAVPLLTAGIAGVQLACTHFLHFGLPCAFHASTGLPCPGCGLTRSVLTLLRGHPEDSFLLHPFGPPLFLAMLFALVVGILPQAPRSRIAGVVESFELRTGILPLLFVAFMVVWVLRVVGVIHLTAI